MQMIHLITCRSPERLSAQQLFQQFRADVLRVLRQRMWVVTCAGYAVYTAVLGVYAYWGPKAGKSLFDLHQETADISFGAVTVLTGGCHGTAWQSVNSLHFAVQFIKKR